jgi:subtilisin family serine protease
MPRLEFNDLIAADLASSAAPSVRVHGACIRASLDVFGLGVCAVAEILFERNNIGRRRRGWACRLRACLLTVAVCLVMATAADVLTQIGVRTEGHWAVAASRFFIAAAQAKKQPQKSKKEDFRDDNDGDGQPQAKNADVNAGGETQPQAKNTDIRANGDERSPGSARNAESTPEGQAKSAGPPKTIAEALERLIEWVQPRPQTMPPWPEAKVIRATPEDKDALPRGKLPQKAQATKRPANRVAADILPHPGTYRPNELLVLGATPTVLGKLQARGWQRSQGAAQGVVRLVSESENPVVAREQLQSEFQGAHFALNFVYQLASNSMMRRSPDGSAGGGSCDPQRCYGPVLINWRAELAACAAGIKVGIIDTAVDVAHPALAWKRLNVRRLPNHEPASMEPHSHGTGVVSLLTGHPTSGTPGLVPDADYVIADAFIRDRLGKPETDTEHLLWALDVLEEHGAQVVNMSLSGPKDDLVYQRLVELSRKGIVFVAAAGNGGSDASAYPAAYKEEVIAVTAVDRNQRVYDHANHGDYIDVAAPGVRIWTALPNGKEGLQSGTSFAAPFVTAIVAAIYKNALLPAMSDPRELRGPKALALAHLSTAKIGRDETVGLGLVRAPSNCAAGKRRQAPTVQLPPPIQLNRWETRVHQASSQPAN